LFLYFTVADDSKALYSSNNLPQKYFPTTGVRSTA
jgi:hypothetical protein